ncbi:UDP-3-O-acyl-N-acetylglucosamine deacetylase [Vampirovibrio chlorellavorus]|uniref:UDP-3-O-acyl-N-acetylglucosamine deacetylase n=1 Tax=Vampirovibrio chlorellavorus TaxID=758823 RepID=UPI0026EA0ABF|nr:UDP-3-O-acyl-N-acetylglucosamine deacetylase [Vampirovibrio chlorellavorus]
MISSTTDTPVLVSGLGVITGKPVDVRIQLADPGHGIVFYLEGGAAVPARLTSVVQTDRGVTLASRNGPVLSPVLSIVEHFLCAAALAGLSDLKVSVSGAPEMPILDGSAQDWLKVFATHFDLRLPAPSLALNQAVFYRHNDDIALYAVPDTHFKISYSVDFDHPDLKSRWVRWDSQTDNPALISTACTFGYVSELPALQARGLALGASLENSLGLFEEGGYSRALRHEDEPIYHKALDLIGDLSLMGVNPLAIKAHVFALNAGHSSHVPFAQKLRNALRLSD